MRLLIALALAAPAAAQASRTPVTVIHAGRLLAEPGQGAARGEDTITVQNGRIVSVADGFDLRRRAGLVARVRGPAHALSAAGVMAATCNLAYDAGRHGGAVWRRSRGSPGHAALRAQWKRHEDAAGLASRTGAHLGDAGGATLALRDAV
jgi:hypothetical protein